MAQTPHTLARKVSLRPLDLLTRREWTLALHGEAHTRFVRRMRMAMPLAAFAIIATLLAWPQMGRNIQPANQDSIDGVSSSGQNEVLNPRFESRDEDRQPYTITASSAVQNNQNPDEVFLETPLADITLNSGKWIAVESRKGLFDQKKRFLSLRGNVRLYHDDGYEIVTQSLDIDLAARTAQSTQPVSGQGPAGSIDAQGGLTADSDSGTLVLKGPARLVLNRAITGF